MFEFFTASTTCCTETLWADKPLGIESDMKLAHFAAGHANICDARQARQLRPNGVSGESRRLARSRLSEVRL